MGVFSLLMMPCVLSVLLAALLTSPGTDAALLDDYVNAGPAYLRYEHLPSLAMNGSGKAFDKHLSWTAACLNVTSQKWLTEDDWGADWGGKDAEWWHLVYIITPSEIKTPGWRNIYVTGGQNDDKQYDSNNEDMITTATLAMTSGAMTVAQFQVPNVPFYIRSEPAPQQRLTQDHALAHSFVHYMDYIRDGGDSADLPAAEWVLLLPMVKAGFAAMAAVDHFLAAAATAAIASVEAETKVNWQVTGASKRGWVAWLMGAVDAARPAEQQVVRSIAPIVLDGLNFHEFFHLHYGSYGGWSFPMEAFVDVGFTGRIDSPEMQTLLDVMDPYNYLDRMAGLPKLVSDGTGDEWFIPDDSRNWIDRAVQYGPVSLSMIPDAEHSMVTGLASLLPNLGSFFYNVAKGRTNPSISWTADYDAGQIVLQVDPAHKDLKRSVQMWHSVTCQGDSPRRDFRMINNDLLNTGGCPCGQVVPGSDTQCFNLWAGIWQNSTLSADLALDSGGLIYSASVKAPRDIEKRWEAFFLTVTFHEAAPELADGSVAARADLTEEQGCTTHLINDGGRKTCLPVVFPGDLQVATQVMVLPDTRPFSCSGEACQGDGTLL